MPVTIKSMNSSQQLKFVATLLALLSVIELLNLLTGRSLNHFGLIPRQISHLPGILVSPFLHGSLSHFLSNLVPLGVFSFFALQYGVKRYTLVSLWLIVITGVLVWLFGRSAVHVGSSGLIYGYFGYLVLAGFLSRQVKLILVSIGIALLYGGLLAGVMPGRPFVSWESHLFGMLAGLFAAWHWAKPSRV